MLRPRPFNGALKAIAAGSWRRKDRTAISSSGYVVSTLEASLWCVGRTRTFAEAVLLAANLGDDADTVAAVTGQLAGALYGRSGIPAHWLDRLAEARATLFCDTSQHWAAATNRTFGSAPISVVSGLRGFAR